MQGLGHDTRDQKKIPAKPLKVVHLVIHPLQPLTIQGSIQQTSEVCKNAEALHL
jgi:hypothetical protein